MPPCGGALDRRPAGIRQPEHGGHLVEGLAGRVVDGSAQELEIQRPAATVQAAVAAADDQAHAGKDVALGRQPAGIDVGLEVIDGHQRDLPGDADRLGGHQADQQRAGQAGRVGHGHGVDVGQRQARLAQRLVDDRQNPFEVRPEAISGTTPPNRRCSSSCEATTEASTSSRSVTIAAAVSSQVVSRVRMCIEPSGLWGRQLYAAFRETDGSELHPNIVF